MANAVSLSNAQAPCLGRSKLLIGTVLIAATLMGCGAKSQAAGESFATTMAGHLSRLDSITSSPRVLFLGSSTFQALDTAAVTPKALNLSIGGETLTELGKRVSSYRNVKVALATVLNSGFNDLASNCQALNRAQLDALLGQLPQQAPLLVLGLQTPSEGVLASRCAGRLEALIQEANSALKAVCESRTHCRFINHPTSLATASQRADLLSQDGIHLSTLGYAHLVKVLRGALPENLRATGD